MSSINIKINKTTRQVEFKIDDKVITEGMAEKIKEICDLLFIDSSQFQEKQAFNMIFNYIKCYHRLLYSQISNIVYAYYDEHTTEEATNALGTMISNIQKIVDYTGTNEYKEQKVKNQKADPSVIKVYEDTEKVLIKIWDHINLAQTQYYGLKQTDEEYLKKFNDSIEPFKKDLVKDMNAQLLTMVSIFTALAFLVFGGISSLGSIFSNHEIPILKSIIVGSVWGLCILNLIFVFLFCVGKMTGLNFKSSDEPDANIVKRYPIVWWSDLVILTILAGSLWAYYLNKWNIDSQFKSMCSSSPIVAMLVGFGIILIAFIISCKYLLKLSKK